MICWHPVQRCCKRSCQGRSTSGSDRRTASNIRFEHPRNGQLHGRAAILEELRTLHAFRFKGTRIFDLEHSTKLLAPDIAVIRVNWEMQGTNLAPGKDAGGRKRPGIFTQIAQRTTKASWTSGCLLFCPKKTLRACFRSCKEIGIPISGCLPELATSYCDCGFLSSFGRPLAG